MPPSPTHRLITVMTHKSVSMSVVKDSYRQAGNDVQACVVASGEGECAPERGPNVTPRRLDLPTLGIITVEGSDKRIKNCQGYVMSFEFSNHR